MLEKEYKQIRIDKKNDVILTVVFWEGDYGTRFNFTLEVEHTDPFVNAPRDGLDGYVSAATAERAGRKHYMSFRPGDELCQGVFKV